MSVTFSCPDAPIRHVPCVYCQEAQGGGYDHDGRCEPGCPGTMTVSTAPEVNWANTNARVILGLLGFSCDDLYGESDGGTLRQAILRVRNGDRSSAEWEPQHTPAGQGGMKVTDEGGVARIQRMGPQVFQAGNTDVNTLRRLANLETLAMWSQQHHMMVVWG